MDYMHRNIKWNYAFFKVAVLFLAAYQVFHSATEGIVLAIMFLLCYTVDIKKE